jgi:CheY-like chemotaxis protein
VVGAAGSGDGWWALVAADDSEFWFTLRRELPGLEERLLTVRTGRDCLRAIEDRRIRLVVLDSSLGDVSGSHLAHLVRQIRPELGIVMTFHQSDQAQEREARQAGVLYYGDREGTREIAQYLLKGLTPSGDSANQAAGGRREGTGSRGSKAASESSRGNARTQSGPLDW